MVNVITESGMDFIADNSFRIEKSPLYTDLGDGIRSVEFIRAKDDNVIFVEAKTTFPNPNNPSAENYVKFQSEINEICEKFIHSLNLFSSVKVGVRDAQLPPDFSPPDKVTLVFVLVVKTHELGWCRNIEAALIKVLPSYLHRIWKPTVRVINHKAAIKFNLAVVG